MKYSSVAFPFIFFLLCPMIRECWGGGGLGGGGGFWGGVGLWGGGFFGGGVFGGGVFCPPFFVIQPPGCAILWIALNFQRDEAFSEICIAPSPDLGPRRLLPKDRRFSNHTEGQVIRGALFMPPPCRGIGKPNPCRQTALTTTTP